MRALWSVLLVLVLFPAAARAEVVTESDVSVNSGGGVAVAWIGHEGRYSTLRVAQGTLAGGIGTLRTVATAMRTGGADDDYELVAPRVELFDDGSLLLVWQRNRWLQSRYADNRSDLYASVDYGPAQQLAAERGGLPPLGLAADPSGWAVLAWETPQGLAIVRRAPREAQLRLDGVAAGMGNLPSAGISASGEATVTTTRNASLDCSVLASQVGPTGFQPARLVATARTCLPETATAVGSNGDVATFWNADGELRGALGSFGGFATPQTIVPRTGGLARGGMGAGGEVVALATAQSSQSPQAVVRVPGETSFRAGPTSLPSGAQIDVSSTGQAIAAGHGLAFVRRPGEGFGAGEPVPAGMTAIDGDGAMSVVEDTVQRQRLVLARWVGGVRAPDIELSRSDKPPAPPPPEPRPQAIIGVPTAPVRLVHGRMRVRVFCYGSGLDCRVRLSGRVQLPRSRRGKLVTRWSGTVRSGQTRLLRLKPRRGTRARMVLLELETRGGAFVDRRSLVLRR